MKHISGFFILALITVKQVSIRTYLATLGIYHRIQFATAGHTSTGILSVGKVLASDSTNHWYSDTNRSLGIGNVWYKTYYQICTSWVLCIFSIPAWDKYSTHLHLIRLSHLQAQNDQICFTFKYTYESCIWKVNHCNNIINSHLHYLTQQKVECIYTGHGAHYIYIYM